MLRIIFLTILIVVSRNDLGGQTLRCSADQGVEYEDNPLFTSTWTPGKLKLLVYDYRFIELNDPRSRTVVLEVVDFAIP